ncbi:MAG TPA: hypothetical protein VMM83_00345 [Longimicrobiales bacterium]|nr:hypothetical protein [Longimicrobiales bacterium]
MTELRVMNDPQRQADRIRELVADTDAVRRLGIEVLWAEGTPDEVTLRARRQDATLTAARGPGWLDESAQALATTLSRDLVADVLAPPHPMTLDAPRWGRAADRAHRRPGPPSP